MIQTIEEEKTHSEITNKLRLMLESYKMLRQIKTLRANRTLESIYTFLYLARKNSQSKIARKFLKEIFVESGVKDPKILQQIENIDSYIPDIRNTSRPFSQEDSQIIIERLVENPKECVYNSLTNKVSYPLEITESLQNDFIKIKSGLENLSQTLGKNYSNFEGGFWIDNDRLRHKFTNPRESQMNNWFFYSAKRLNSENN